METFIETLFSISTRHEILLYVLVGWNVLLSLGVFAVMLRRN